MFERFTDQTRQVVVLAQEEARKLDHNHIGTEHLLLGLLGDDGGAAATALHGVGMGDLEATRQRVTALVGRGAEPPAGHIPFSLRAKAVFDAASAEAQGPGADDIGPEHVLLGLLREREGAAARVLVGAGADLDEVRRRTHRLLRGELRT